MMERAKKSTAHFLEAHGHKPSLAILTVGELLRYTHDRKRLQFYSNRDLSWFCKESARRANNFHVREVSLPEATTTEELLSQIYSLKRCGYF